MAMTRARARLGAPIYEDPDYAVFVAETAGRVVGWRSLSRYHDRYGYRFTCENSIYIAASQFYAGRNLRD